MNNPYDLTGKVAIVTGASRGIGRAIAETLANAGAQVVISSRKQDALDAVATEMRAEGGDVTPIAAHNGDQDALNQLVVKTIERYGKLDILVNNAATNPHFGRVLDAPDSMWQKTIEVNIMGMIWLCRAVVPHMVAGGGGKIINVASIVGLTPGQFAGIYSMTKAGVISLTKTLAMELGSDNIQVNAIAPGLIKTQFAQVLWENEHLLQEVIDSSPVGRIGVPQDIANASLFLASSASDFATGEVIVLDGGLTLKSI